jgi:phosphoglycolate phosphatase-like HAD superfamily hydrolase
MSLTHVVLDFDGTCTQVEQTQAAYLEAYRALLVDKVTDRDSKARIGPVFAAAWGDAVAAIQAASPGAGWTTLSKVSAAPAAADPYILSGEAVAWLTRRWLEAHPASIPVVPADLYKQAYDSHAAPWRDELTGVLDELVDLGVKVAFVSNSSEATIKGRLDDLLAAEPELRAKIAVVGNAAKYEIRELDWDEPLTRAQTRPFRKLRPARSAHGLERPIYLRRGSYYRALLRVWGETGPTPVSTLVVGDVYELDLAMPAALGAQIHLVERAAPFATCDYERALTRKAGGKITADLTRLPARVAKLRKK